MDPTLDPDLDPITSYIHCDRLRFSRERRQYPCLDPLRVLDPPSSLMSWAAAPHPPSLLEISLLSLARGIVRVQTLEGESGGEWGILLAPSGVND